MPDAPPTRSGVCVRHSLTYGSGIDAQRFHNKRQPFIKGPGGEKARSQGREPLESGVIVTSEPRRAGSSPAKGVAVAPPALLDLRVASHQGLAPRATRCRPSGAVNPSPRGAARASETSAKPPSNPGLTRAPNRPLNRVSAPSLKSLDGVPRGASRALYGRLRRR